MAKKNKKGGWTGASAGSNAVKSSGGPQVDPWLQPQKAGPKRSIGQRIGRAVIFILVCVLAGSLIYQAIPKGMAEYWGVLEQKDAVSKVEITVFDESGDAHMKELTSSGDIDAFCAALEESKLKRLWFSNDGNIPFTSEIQIFLDNGAEAAFDAGMVGNHVYLLYMPTYNWYLDEDAPVMEYLK